jgi:hypothetical protein
MSAKTIWEFVADAKRRHLNRTASTAFLQRVLDGNVKIVETLPQSTLDTTCYYDGECSATHQCAECVEGECSCSDCCVGLAKTK